MYRKNVFDQRKVKAITRRFIEVMFVLVSILDDLLWSAFYKPADCCFVGDGLKPRIWFITDVYYVENTSRK